MYSHSFAERVKFPNIEPDIGKCLNFLELCLDIWPSSGVYFTLGIIFKCDVISVGDELSIPHEVAREKAKNYLRLAYQADKTHADAVYHLADLLIQEDVVPISSLNSLNHKISFLPTPKIPNPQHHRLRESPPYCSINSIATHQFNRFTTFTNPCVLCFDLPKA
eukprot:TRINITY_DN479_c0_g1_i11.p1 TRINITY_DN479_c0_g1~~TRINITY_DN479_c0_g1_i11.p1  ORF type:complete len:164 (+),score=19.43 TRINITY_DN479_c0_g1_i11:83-574(+)